MAESKVKWRSTQNLAEKLNGIAKRVDKNLSLQVGIFGGERYTPRHPIRGTKRQPLHVAQVAFWNEYGTKRMPARPFFGTAVEAYKQEWSKNFAAILRKADYDGTLALMRLGYFMKEDIEQVIQEWTDPPNAKRTVEIKGFNKPLIDDGTMQRAIDFQLTDKLDRF